MYYSLVLIVACVAVGCAAAPERSRECGIAHEVYGTLNPCEATCGRLHQVCTSPFIQLGEGCQCGAGYAREPKTQECIEKHNCEDYKLCPAGMEWLECGSACIDSCNQETMLCTANCVQGCYCRKGTYKREGACITKEEC